MFTPISKSNTNPTLKFITVARLVPCKGIGQTIEAFSKLQTRSFEYHIIGDGLLMPSLKKLVNKYNLTRQIKFHGPLEQESVIKNLQQGDYFILFGITDNNGEIDAQGLVVQEAQACGLPVIVSNGGGIPEGVKDLITGYVIEEGNINALSNKIEELILFKSNKVDMGKAARQYASSCYSQTNINKAVFSIYEKILS
jgi:colanic acid/amylovoran biosynthesis glycosyltransferase